jgi:hypothetical protein
MTTKLVWTILAAGTMLAGCASTPTSPVMTPQQSAVYHVQGGTTQMPAEQPAAPAPELCVGCNPIPMPIGAGFSPDSLDDILANQADFSSCGPVPCADTIDFPDWAGPAANNLGIGFTFNANPHITIPDHRRRK